MPPAIPILKYILTTALALFTTIAAAILWARSSVTDLPRAVRENAVVVYKTETPPPPSTLKIVTFNLGYASGDKNNLGAVLSREEVIKNLDEAVRVLGEFHPDIICLQEVDFSAARTHGMDELDELARKLGMASAAYAVNWSKRYVPYPYWPPERHFGRLVSGQAVMSRYPILKNELTRMSRPPHPFWYDWFYLDRLAQRVEIELGGGNTLALWNVHLEAFHAPTRIAQAGALARMVNTDTSPFKIVAGDLNAPQEGEDISADGNAAYELIAGAGLQADLEFDDAPTFPAWSPAEKLDHILFNAPLALKASGTLATTASDHLPVWAEIALPEGP